MFLDWEFSKGQMQVALNQLNPLFLLMMLIGVVGSLPIIPKLAAKARTSIQSWEVVTGLSYIGGFILLLLCMLSLSGSTYNPFIYFRF